MTDIQTALFALRDPAYQAFQSKLIPTIDPQTVIGVRMPALRKLAREIAGTPVAEGFLQELPHRYYEENNLHGLLISAIPDYDGAVAALETFLPYVDNWATCDLLSPKAFRKHPPELRKQIRRWVETLGSNGILGVNVSGRYDGSDIGKMERETILRAELERYLFKTKELLAANRDLVQELADALLKKQTLLHSDIQSICGRYRAVPAT